MTLVFVAITVIGFIVMTSIGGVDPMRSGGGRGPEWECDPLRGAVVCTKDVKPPKPAHR